MRFGDWDAPSAELPAQDGASGALAVGPAAAPAEAIQSRPVPLDICRKWTACRQARQGELVNTVALSKMHALEYERKRIHYDKDHPEYIPDTERLRPRAKKEDYEAEQMRAFLMAVGETDPDAILERAKLGGTGALHTQWRMGVATVSGVLGGLGLLFPDPATKAGIFAARAALQVGVLGATVDSAHRRAVNANAEDMMWHGKVGPAPTAQSSLSIVRASMHVLKNLRYSKADAAEMKAATESLADALRELDSLDSNATREKLARAEREAELALARFCFMAETKGDYKAAVEKGKIEFRGNELQSYANGAGGLLVMIATLLTILTPSVLAAPITAGASLGAVGLSALIYLAFQVSEGPGQDSQAKIERALVAWAKSLDTFPGAQPSSFQKRRAAAYGVYKNAQASWWKLSADSRGAKEQAAMDTLMVELQAISAQEFQAIDLSDSNDVEDPSAARQNWLAYRKLETDARDLAKNPEPPQAAVDAMQAAFMQTVIREEGVAPARKRLDDARRLLKAELATVQRELTKRRSPPLVRLRRNATPSSQQDESKRRFLERRAAALERNLVELRQATVLLQGAPGANAMAQAANLLSGIGSSAVKSLLLSFGAGLPFQAERAAAYVDYARACEAADALSDDERQKAHANAKARLVERLGKNPARSTPSSAPHTSVPASDWDACRALEDAQSRALTAPADVEARLEELTQNYVTAHQSQFDGAVCASAWKGPMCVRMQNAESLLSGKIAQSQKRLMAFAPAHRLAKGRDADGHRIGVSKRADLLKQQALRQELKRDLLDRANLAMMKHHLRESAPSEPALNRAGVALGLVGNSDVRALFSGDATEQVDASWTSKSLSFGERSKYVDTIVGAQLFPIIANTAVMAVDLGIAGHRVHDQQLAQGNPDHQGSIPDSHLNVHKSIGVSQQATSLQIHAVNADRITMRDGVLADMRQSVGKPDGEIDHCFSMGLPVRDFYDGADADVDVALNRLVDQMLAWQYVPEFLRIEVGPQHRAGGSAADPADPAAPAPIDIDLRGTAGYSRVRFKRAKIGAKAAFVKLEASSVLKELGKSVASVPAQLLVKPALISSRAPLRNAEAHLATNRKARMAVQNHAPQGLSDAPAPDAPTDALAEEMAQLLKLVLQPLDAM